MTTKIINHNYYAGTEFIPESYLQQQFKARGNWTRIPLTLNSKPTPGGREIRVTSAPLHWANNPVHTVPRDKLKTTPDLDYIYVDGKCLLDKTHYGVKTNLKNIINKKHKLISEKNDFIDQMTKDPKCRQFIQETINIDMLELANDPEVSVKQHKPLFTNPTTSIYIFKPISGYGGAGIQRFNTFEGFNNYCAKIISQWSGKWQDTNNAHRDFYRYWQLQQYITNPLLIRMKPDNKLYKFHIRLHYIFRPGDKKSFYLKRGLMATALKPYYQGNWHDKQIHDTHFQGRIGESFPEALNLNQAQLAGIYSQLNELFSEIDKILKSASAGCYEESRYCYHLFGADIMLTRDYKVKVLEVNDSPGLFYMDNPILPPELKSIVENVMDQVVDDYFPPRHKPTNPYANDVTYLD